METIIVLSRAETSLNVGAVCRVMANTDIETLRIVGDKNIYNEREVLTLALHARNIWDKAQFFPPTIKGLKDATKDCNAVFATTRRVGAKRKHQGFFPNSFIQFANKEKFEKIAIVFGNERTGLTDEEIKTCSHSINIPSSEKYPSYNLSHAVLIIAYSLFTNSIDQKHILEDDNTPLLKWQSREKENRKMITFSKACKIAEDIATQLNKMGLYKKGGKEDCISFLSNMMIKAKLKEEEGDFFKNIFNKLYYSNTEKNHPL